MKKRFIYLTLVILIVFFAGIFWVKYSSKRELRQIELNDVFDSVRKGQDMIVYYGQEDCGECREFSKIIDRIMTEKNISVSYIDSDKMSADEKEKFTQFEIETTPALFIVTKGNVYIYRNLDNEEDIEKAVTQINIDEERFDELKEIDYKELDKKTKLNIDFLLYIGREDCRDCRKFYPIVQQYISENSGMGMYYFDIKKYRDLANSGNEKSENASFYDELKKRYEIEWVPSVYHIRNGIIVDKYEFLNEEYYELDTAEQQASEELYIQEFEEWMKRECLSIK